MNQQDSYLLLVVGKTVTDIEYNLATVASINPPEGRAARPAQSIYLQLKLQEYTLHIYNHFTTYPVEGDIDKYLGLKVIEVAESNTEVKLIFDNGSKIIVDLRDEAYTDPEAMYLRGPNNFAVVWN
jgi:hypothetical protein